MIRLEHVAAGYLPGQEILRDVSLRLERGTFHFLSGASGAGKTTLLALLALQQRPARGKIHMFDHEISALPRAHWPALRRRIGLVSQEDRLLPHLSVEENVGLPLKVSGETAAHVRTKVAEMLEWVGLSDYRAERPRMLSGGERQRVAIARAVVTKPDILLCDEPTGNLDHALAERVLYLFDALHRMGTTVFFATHDETLLAGGHHPVLRLHQGVIG